MSIVGGRSSNGTTEVLAKLREEMRTTTVTYYLSTTDVDPMKTRHDRFTELAKMRNLVMDSLVWQPDLL